MRTMLKMPGSFGFSKGLDRSGRIARTPDTGRFGVAGRVAKIVWQALILWQRRFRDRRHLEGLDDRMLKDIGLTRANVEREAGKPFWQA